MGGHNNVNTGEDMRWPEKNEDAFLAILYERVKRHPNGTPSFKQVDWNEIDEELFSVIGQKYGADRLQGKYNRLRLKHRQFSDLISYTGVTYSSSSNQVYATEEVWKLFKKIMVCSNHMNIQDDVNQVVAHELIHAYDDCQAANLDWADCAHHACSEIRAGHLSGDCHYKRELLRGYIKLRGHEQECVRRRVMKSVIANPYCSEAAAKDAMEAVWDVCYNDTRPFDRAP